MTPGQRAHAAFMAAMGRADRAGAAWVAIGLWSRAGWDIAAVAAVDAYHNARALDLPEGAAVGAAARALARTLDDSRGVEWDVLVAFGTEGWWRAAALAALAEGDA